MKNAEEVIQELEQRIAEEKEKGNTSFFGFSYVINTLAVDAIEKYFLSNGCYYAKLSACGCGDHTYDVILQWI